MVERRNPRKPRYEITARVLCDGVGCSNAAAHVSRIDPGSRPALVFLARKAAIHSGWEFTDGQAFCPDCIKKED